MGAWGAGSFENDAALDFVSEIETSEDLQRPLQLDDEVGAIDADQASQIIVVAEFLAAQRGHPCQGFPDELNDQLRKIAYSPELLDEARNCISAVIARSELAKLWAEGDASEWNVAMTDLIERLGRPKLKAGAKPKKRKAKKPTPNMSPCMFCDQPMGDDAFHMIDITLNDDEISSMKTGGWTHLKCLNAALHPKHMIQNWQFDEEEIEAAVAKLLDRDAE